MNTTPVKISWRKQEIFFVSIMSILVLCNYLWEAFSISPEVMEDHFVQVYKQYQLSFSYGVNVLLPQVMILLLVVGGYMLLTINVSRLAAYSKKQYGLLKFSIRIAGLLLLVNLALSFGVATATDLAHPWLFNYSHFHLLAWFGPQPNLFRAFTNAAGLTGFFALYAVIRELVIVYIERAGHKNSYRVLVANQVTGIFFIHLLAFWLLHFFELFNRPDYRTYFALISPFLFVYVSNMYWLFPRNEGQSSWMNSKFILSLVTTTLIFCLPFLLSVTAQEYSELYFVYWIVQLAVVTPITWYLYKQRRDRILQWRNIEKALSRSKADIKLLRSQINPHFLFNTLNTLYGTALLEGGYRTAEGIQRLGDMMRFMLREDEAENISLEEEIEYLKNYIALQQRRVQSSPNMHIESQLDSNQCNHSIAPMILIPLVENAFKHGISLVEKSWVYIQLACDSTSIRFEIRNSIHPGKKEDTIWESPGIGLANVTERLKLIYPGTHDIQFNNDGKEFHVQLTIRF